MATLLDNLKNAVRLADKAVALILYDENTAAPLAKLQEFTDLIASFSDTPFFEYEQYAEVLFESGNLDTIYTEKWLKSAIERINLAIFTAALWTEHSELDTLVNSYFSTVIPVSIEFSDAIIKAYFEVQARLLFRDIEAALDAADGEEIEVGYLYTARLGPRSAEGYDIPQDKDGIKTIRLESECKFDQFMDMDLEQFEQRVTPESLRNAWRRALSDIETHLTTVSDDEHAYNNNQQGDPDRGSISQKQITSLNMGDSDHVEDVKNKANNTGGNNNNAAEPSPTRPKLTGIQLALAMEDAEEAAKEHYREASKNVSKNEIVRDFRSAPEAPAFLVDIVRPYLLNLVSENTDEDLIDAACDAAASFRDELQIGMKLRVLRSGPLSCDAFRKLLPPPGLAPSSTIIDLSTIASPSAESPLQQENGPEGSEPVESQEPTGSSNSQSEESSQESQHESQHNDAHEINEREPSELSEDRKGTHHHTTPPRIDEVAAEDQESLIAPSMDWADGMPQRDLINEEHTSTVMESATDAMDPADASDSDGDEFVGSSSRSVANAQQTLFLRCDVQTTNRIWPPRRAGLNHARQQVRIEEETDDTNVGEPQEAPQPAEHNLNPPSSTATTALHPPSKRQKTSKLRKVYRPWTDEELDALSKGFRAFGPQWTLIKSEYSDALKIRSNVDIKDKVRNIIKQRQADGEPLEHWAIRKRD